MQERLAAGGEHRPSDMAPPVAVTAARTPSAVGSRSATLTVQAQNEQRFVGSDETNTLTDSNPHALIRPV